MSITDSYPSLPSPIMRMRGSAYTVLPTVYDIRPPLSATIAHLHLVRFAVSGSAKGLEKWHTVIMRAAKLLYNRGMANAMFGFSISLM